MSSVDLQRFSHRVIAAAPKLNPSFRMVHFLKTIFALSLSLTAISAQAREWTVDGTTKIEAEFGGSMGDFIFLKLPDGHRTKYLLSALSSSDQAFVRERPKGTTSLVQSAPPPNPVARRSGSYAVMANALQTKLVAAGPSGFVDVALQNPRCEYYVLYFSAGWCGPCHRFTPTLVEFYNRVHKTRDNFEVIFISRDHSAPEMLSYMQEFSMPWPAIRYSDIPLSPELTRYAGKGIPCVVVLDAQGNVLSHSYVKGEYVGPVEPIKALAKLLEPSPKSQ